MKVMAQALFLVLVLSGFCSCGHKPYPQPLITADSLTNVLPDSAITLLKNIENALQNEPEATRMYYRLLCIKANDNRPLKRDIRISALRTSTQ